MTARERILAALNHEPPDRTPTDGWFHHEVMDALKRHYGTDDWSVVLAELGIDGWAELGPDLAPARLAGQDIPRPGHASGVAAVRLDERTYEDVWGVRFRLDTDGRYREWVSGPLGHAQTLRDLEQFQMLTTADIREPEHYVERVAQLKAEDRFVYANLENPFRRLWHLRGYENALMDYLIHTDILEAVYDSLFSLYTDMALSMTRGGVDMVRIVGDIAMQDRVIMGPEPWRRFDKPRLAELIAACREANPRIHFFFHSDGQLTDLMDDLIEVGFDVINPIQPECMDPAELKRKYGDRLAFWGTVGTQTTMPFGTPADVRRVVRERIETVGKDGGLVIAPTQILEPDVPWENVIAFFEAVEEYA